MQWLPLTMRRGMHNLREVEAKTITLAILVLVASGCGARSELDLDDLYPDGSRCVSSAPLGPQLDAGVLLGDGGRHLIYTTRSYLRLDEETDRFVEDAFLPDDARHRDVFLRDAILTRVVSSPLGLERVDLDTGMETIEDTPAEGVLAVVDTEDALWVSISEEGFTTRIMRRARGSEAWADVAHVDRWTNDNVGVVAGDYVVFSLVEDALVSVSTAGGEATVIDFPRWETGSLYTGRPMVGHKGYVYVVRRNLEPSGLEQLLRVDPATGQVDIVLETILGIDKLVSFGDSLYGSVHSSDTTEQGPRTDAPVSPDGGILRINPEAGCVERVVDSTSVSSLDTTRSALYFVTTDFFDTYGQPHRLTTTCPTQCE